MPYKYIKQQVDVRLTRAMVEIFFSATHIASHLRLHGCPNQYSTVENHMPPDHQACAPGMAASCSFYSVQYICLLDLLMEISVARVSGTYWDYMKKLRKEKLLI